MATFFQKATATTAAVFDPGDQDDEVEHLDAPGGGQFDGEPRRLVGICSLQVGNQDDEVEHLNAPVVDSLMASHGGWWGPVACR